jgi:hypothetical protein
LIRHVLPEGKRLLGRGFTFQEDNDPKHASKLCRGYLERKENAGVYFVMFIISASSNLLYFIL